MESTCTAVYISPNKCANIYLKFLAVEEQIAISGGIMVRIPQYLDVVTFSSRNIDVLESRCRGTSSFCGILSLMPPEITTSSRFSTTVGCCCSVLIVFVLYLLFNTVIAMAVARKALERISILI